MFYQPPISFSDDQRKVINQISKIQKPIILEIQKIAKNEPESDEYNKKREIHENKPPLTLNSDGEIPFSISKIQKFNLSLKGVLANFNATQIRGNGKSGTPIVKIKKSKENLSFRQIMHRLKTRAMIKYLNREYDVVEDDTRPLIYNKIVRSVSKRILNTLQFKRLKKGMRYYEKKGLTKSIKSSWTKTQHEVNKNNYLTLKRIEILCISKGLFKYGKFGSLYCYYDPNERAFLKCKSIIKPYYRSYKIDKIINNSLLGDLSSCYGPFRDWNSRRRGNTYYTLILKGRQAYRKTSKIFCLENYKTISTIHINFLKKFKCSFGGFTKSKFLLNKY